jgi:hypothetical protein
MPAYVWFSGLEHLYTMHFLRNFIESVHLRSVSTPR